ncbi:hypothetical protein AOQ84DRAFT_441487 [Glonium stellatum]|uniref:G-patch domain-containing protein n=1 Tax=Glonium stellatum TaxID=574774 RepID=A0A8E2JQ09_9PEZI|nr:hypothetical protein AOQ84DRAFT_441487 [Glonium stellatum]
MADSDEDTYTVPLKDQRVFGAGIKRKRVQFVPASTTSATTASTSRSSGSSLAEQYLSIVLPKTSETCSTSIPAPETPQPTCDVCNLPFQPGNTGVPHEASLAHQVCLKHSHPPSAIDRTRKGLSYLESYGWDPDSRTGLGASGEGILYPIKAKEKRDTVGLGAKTKLLKDGEPLVKKKPEKLDAGRVRKLEEEGKKKREKLQQIFYQNDDVLRTFKQGFVGALPLSTLNYQNAQEAQFANKLTYIKFPVKIIEGSTTEILDLELCKRRLEVHTPQEMVAIAVSTLESNAITYKPSQKYLWTLKCYVSAECGISRASTSKFKRVHAIADTSTNNERNKTRPRSPFLVLAASYPLNL